MALTKKQWFLIALVSLIFLFFFLGWLAIEAVILSAGSSWLNAVVWIFLGIALLALVPFAFEERSFLMLVAVIAFVPSLFFVQAGIVWVGVILGVGFCGYSLILMREDIALNRLITVRKSMQYGASPLVFAFAVSIALFYYAHIQNESGEVLLQRLELERASHAVMTQALGYFNPEFKTMDTDKMTVDTFLITMQAGQNMSDLTLETPTDTSILETTGLTPTDPRAPLVLAQIKKGLAQNTTTFNTKQLVLVQSRNQLSKVVGMTLTGQEPIAAILSSIISQRVSSYFEPTMAQNGSSSVLSFILTLVLFLTLWSLGSIFGFVWRLLTAGLFFLACRFRILEIKTILVEKEVVA
jgi:hypothetical protein